MAVEFRLLDRRRELLLFHFGESAATDAASGLGQVVSIKSLLISRVQFLVSADSAERWDVAAIGLDRKAS